MLSAWLKAFNKYYAHTRILDESPERDSRLALSYSAAVVPKKLSACLVLMLQKKCKKLKMRSKGRIFNLINQPEF